MVIATPLTHPHPAASNQEGGRLVSTSGRTLPLEKTELRAESGGGIARTILVQHFRNPYPEALRVTYKLPLPADGAVSGFSFQVGDEVVEGEVDRKQEARARFERALVEGRTAALVEEERSSLFTQQVGNIPPGEGVICQTTVDHPLRWLLEGAWEYRFPTVVGARYMGSAVQTPDAKKLAIDVSEEKMAARLSLSLSITDSITNKARLESPSHAVELAEAEHEQVVSFRKGTPVRLDRDVVVRWPVAKLEVGIQLGVMRRENDGKEEGFGLLTIVPPSPESKTPPVPRDLIFLIDTSGSMSGQPLRQATSIAASMIDTLHDEDQIELIEFSNSPRAYKSKPVVATPQNRKDAIRWLKALRASGSTEMESALRKAIDPLRKGAQRQVVLITDGYIGFEERIVKYVLDELPRSCRVHAVGVGSAVNRTLTQGVARAGGGVEVVLGIDEDVEGPASRLLARTADPVVIELDVRGPGVTQVVPVRLPDLFAGSPSLIPVRLDAQGGEIVVRGRSADGNFEARLPFDPIAAGQGSGAFAKLFAREWVEDLEAYRMVANQPEDTDQQIEAVGLEFQISTRKTSWVAVSRTRRVAEDIGQRTEEVPQEIPHGVSIAGFGLRSASGPTGGAAPKKSEFFSRSRSTPERASRGRAFLPPAELGDVDEESSDSLSSREVADAGVDAFESLESVGAPALGEVTGESLSPFQDEDEGRSELPTDSPPPPAPGSAPAPKSSATFGAVTSQVSKLSEERTKLEAPIPASRATMSGRAASSGRSKRNAALLLLLLALVVLIGWLIGRAFSVPEAPARSEVPRQIESAPSGVETK